MPQTQEAENKQLADLKDLTQPILICIRWMMASELANARPPVTSRQQKLRRMIQRNRIGETECRLPAFRVLGGDRFESN
jgi:hypothetical protein